MRNILIVVDMQNDFIDGSLGTKEAQEIVPKVVEKINSFDGRLITTYDTHFEDYLSTQEGEKLPIEHCLLGTNGWQLHPDVQQALQTNGWEYNGLNDYHKMSFGSTDLFFDYCLLHKEQKKIIKSITLIGLCTDICVISNAMLLKAALPEAKIIVDASCCAGVTPESHKNALEAMKMCQIEVINE